MSIGRKELRARDVGWIRDATLNVVWIVVRVDVHRMQARIGRSERSRDVDERRFTVRRERDAADASAGRVEEESRSRLLAAVRCIPVRASFPAIDVNPQRYGRPSARRSSR